MSTYVHFLLALLKLHTNNATVEAESDKADD